VTGGYLAGWWTRVGATIIDAILVGIVAAILLVAVSGVRGRGISFGEEGLMFIYASILLGVPRAQTVGMMALGTRVVDANTGGLIGFGRSIGRAAVYLILAITIIGGVIDILWPLWDSRNQTLHDKAIGSVLIHIR
jgi:uncharacterized RDD family membrane protein YckC